MDYDLLNIGSLFLGLIAWILPVINLTKNSKAEPRKWVVFSVTSLSACVISLYMQILYGDHLVKKEDWSALMDTSQAVVLASTILLVGTIALNAITFLKYCKKV